MSINRSEIRKSALSLIYALLENSNGESFDLDLFWDIAQEKKRDHYNEAHAKAVLHVCRASADSARLLNERAGESAFGAFENTSRVGIFQGLFGFSGNHIFFGLQGDFFGSFRCERECCGKNDIIGGTVDARSVPELMFFGGSF